MSTELTNVIRIEQASAIGNTPATTVIVGGQTTKTATVANVGAASTVMSGGYVTVTALVKNAAVGHGGSSLAILVSVALAVAGAAGSF
jgi:hypothetical protein